jgi:hypothetical protein
LFCFVGDPESNEGRGLVPIIGVFPVTTKAANNPGLVLLASRAKQATIASRRKELFDHIIIIIYSLSWQN